MPTPAMNSSALAFDASPDAQGAADPAFLKGVDDRLEQARREIEKRFLNAGGVLIEAQEHIQILIQALDRISGAFNAKRADQTIGALQDAIARLQSRIGREARRAQELGAVAVKLATIQDEVARIRSILAYLATCAVSTRVAAAGNDKFMAFANEIANYVRNAEREVLGFSKKVAQMATELEGLDAEHKHVVEVVGAGAGAAAPQLMEAAKTIERHRADLEKLASRAAPVMHAAGDKFSGALSALQVGDSTRQRIEHVQEAMRMLLDMMRRDPDDAPTAPALRLFDVLTAALSQDFDADAHKVVEALKGVAGDARDIFQLVRNFSGGSDRTHDIVATRLGAMRGLVAEIEEADRRSNGVDATIRRLAAELLDTRGDIGNLRRVQGDIRLLAINAHLHGARMGDLGRTIAAIATEINLEGDKLGRSANIILQTLAALMVADEERAEEDGDLVADLDKVGTALQEMDREAGGSVDLIATEGETIAERIEAAVRGLDFSGHLGERLAACAADLQRAAADAGRAGGDRPGTATAFSEAAYARYTMQSERELHCGVFPEARTQGESGGAPERTAPASGDDLDDCFL